MGFENNEIEIIKKRRKSLRDNVTTKEKRNKEFWSID